MALAGSTVLVPGQSYTFEYVPQSLLDVVVNTWALQAEIVKSWGDYATFDKIGYLGTIKITFTPLTEGGTVDSWNQSLTWSLESYLWGKVSFLRAEGGSGFSLIDLPQALGKAVAEAPAYLKSMAGILVVGLVVFLILQSGILKGK